MKTPVVFTLSLLAVSFAIAIHSATAQTVFFDMGRKDGGVLSANGTVVSGNGSLVSNPATPLGGSGSFYWNSFGASTESQSGGSYTSFVDIDNNPLSWTLNNLQSNAVAQGNGGLKGNGWQNGGLIAGSAGGGENPSFSLLGNLATANATGDYWFVQGTGANGTFTLGGLDNTKLYNFKFFGSRVTTAARSTQYFATGLGGTTTSNTLSTSGTDIGFGGYDGNNNTLATISNIAPLSGNITIGFQETAGGFAYMNLMQVDVVPEPTTNALLLLSAVVGGWLFFRRKKVS